MEGGRRAALCTLGAMSGRERVVDYLREARRDELALARTLRSHIAMAPRGEYRRGLEGYLRETRDHARRVERRLAELGAGPGSLRSGARAMREAGGGLIAKGRAPLGVLRKGSADRALSGAQYGCATEGLVIATYTALETVASNAGDMETAALAASIREDEVRMLEWLRHEIVRLTDPFFNEALEPLELETASWIEIGQLSESEVKAALSRAGRDRAHRV
jgi:ferritin-like metal-binding protein YciE